MFTVRRVRSARNERTALWGQADSAGRQAITAARNQIDRGLQKPPQTRASRVAMTEAEWWACEDPWPMLEHLGGKASERKLRLCGAACCWTFYRLIPEERWRQAVEVVERIADGVMTPREAMFQHWGLGDRPLTPLRIGHIAERAIVTASYEPALVASVLADHPEMAELLRPLAFAGRVAAAAVDAVRLSEQGKLPWFRSILRRRRIRFHLRVEASEKKKQAALVRDIFGNPFHLPPALHPDVLAWNNGTLSRLAQSIYGGRAFERLPILGDALEEAGCRDESILSHCRAPEPHVKGCWVLDRFLGKDGAP